MRPAKTYKARAFESPQLNASALGHFSVIAQRVLPKAAFPGAAFGHRSERVDPAIEVPAQPCFAQPKGGSACPLAPSETPCLPGHQGTIH